MSVRLSVASTLCRPADEVADLPNYISCFANLRHLTFADLQPGQKDHYKHNWGGKSFAWVHGAIAALNSPITHLTIEVLVRQPADLHAVDWMAIDVLLSTREVLQSLVRVSVVFLDRVEDEERDPKSIAYPAAIRRQMPLTLMKGLLSIVTRGPKFHP